MCSLRGGEAVAWEAGLGGEASGDGRETRLRRGPGCGGNPVRQMSHTQLEADGGSGWARWSPCLTSRQVLSSGGGVVVSSAIAPRGVSARARHQWLIEPASRRLGAPQARLPLLVKQVIVARGVASCVSCSWASCPPTGRLWESSRSASSWAAASTGPLVSRARGMATASGSDLWCARCHQRSFCQCLRPRHPLPPDPTDHAGRCGGPAD